MTSEADALERDVPQEPQPGEHMLHMRLGSQGRNDYWLICHHDDASFPMWSEARTPWAEGECRCIEAECPCREDEHDACVAFEGNSGEVGNECRGVPEPGCWVQSWWEEQGAEMIADVLWPRNPSFPVPVHIGGGEYPELFPIDIGK